MCSCSAHPPLLLKDKKWKIQTKVLWTEWQCLWMKAHFAWSGVSWTTASLCVLMYFSLPQNRDAFLEWYLQRKNKRPCVPGFWSWWQKTRWSEVWSWGPRKFPPTKGFLWRLHDFETILGPCIITNQPVFAQDGACCVVYACLHKHQQSFCTCIFCSNARVKVEPMLVHMGSFWCHWFSYSSETTGHCLVYPPPEKSSFTLKVAFTRQANKMRGNGFVLFWHNACWRCGFWGEESASRLARTSRNLVHDSSLSCLAHRIWMNSTLPSAFSCWAFYVTSQQSWNWKCENDGWWTCLDFFSDLVFFGNSIPDDHFCCSLFLAGCFVSRHESGQQVKALNNTHAAFVVLCAPMYGQAALSTWKELMRKLHARSIATNLIKATLWRSKAK